MLEAAAAARPRLRFTDTQIEMSHGAGGKASRRLVEGLIAPAFANPVLAALSDAARQGLEAYVKSHWGF